MPDLNVIIHALPVGPTADQANTVVFGVQASAGLSADVVDPQTALKNLWPWTFYGDNGRGAVIGFQAVLVDSTGVVIDTVAPAGAIVDKLDEFGKNLQNCLSNAFLDSERLSAWSVVFDPAHANEPPPAQNGAPRQSFAALVHHLASLPGPISQRLCSTLCVNVERRWLEAGLARGAARLLIVPAKLTYPAATENALNPPALGTRLTSVQTEDRQTALEVTYGTGAHPPVYAFTTGFPLDQVANPPGHPLFDLGAYWLNTYASGDDYAAGIEDLAARALDPFSIFDGIEPADLASAYHLQHAGNSSVLPMELATALRAALIVEAQLDVISLERASDFIATAIEAAAVDPSKGQAAAAEFTKDVAQRWPALPGVDAAPDWLSATSTLLLQRLGAAPAGDSVKNLAAQCGHATSTRLLLALLNTAIGAPSATDTSDLGQFRTDWQTAVLYNPEAGVRAAYADILAQWEGLDPADGNYVFDVLQSVTADESVIDKLTDELTDRLAARFESAPDKVVVDYLEKGAKLISAGDGIAAPQPGPAEAWAKAQLARVQLAGSAVLGTARNLHQGLRFGFGKPVARLVHLENSALLKDGVFERVAGIGVLVRRGTTEADLANRKWRLVTGGVMALDGSAGAPFDPTQAPVGSWCDELLSIPLRATFDRKLLRAEYEYPGQPLISQPPLRFAYPELASATPLTADFSAVYSYQPLGRENFPDQALTTSGQVSAAPPARFGDWYEIATFLQDQCGGLPCELIGSGPRWRLDPTKIEGAMPKGATAKIPWLRGTAPGQVNITPVGSGNDTTPQWPRLPADVVPRVSEWLAAQGNTDRAVPLLMMSAADNKRFAGTLNSFGFQCQAPSIDEAILLAWAMPGIDDPPDAKRRTIGRLKGALGRILTLRAKVGAGGVDPFSASAITLAHDPAITALGFRLSVAPVSPSPTSVVQLPQLTQPLEPTDIDSDYLYKPVSVNVICVASGTAPPLDQRLKSAAQSVTITIAEGEFARLEVLPLAAKADQSRFSPALFDVNSGMGSHVEPHDWIDQTGVHWLAFLGSSVLFEGATDQLPTAEELWQALTVELLPGSSGQVLVKLGSNAPDLRYVDTFSVKRQRWAWRNRPSLWPGALSTAPSEEEKLRLLAGGPPRELDPSYGASPTPVDARPAVLAFDEIAAADLGFVDRGAYSNRLPRAWTAGAPTETALVVDDRDGVANADYLRFGVTVRSRYAGVLVGRSESEAPTDATWRRIVAGARLAPGSLRAPKILAVLPLTQTFDPDMGSAQTDSSQPSAAGPAPHLVLLDEAWYREYGIGERLQVRLNREPLDIGEDPDDKRPYSIGPLSDHALSPQKYYGEATDTDDDAKPVLLDVFGPFGFSLDQSSNQALASATAFVVYPPENMTSHWFASVRFARVLDFPNSPVAQSGYSGNFTMYSLPDSASLASGAGTLILGAETGRLADNLKLMLDPRPEELESGVRVANNSIAGLQYRYFLLVSLAVQDASSNTEVEIPKGLWQLKLFDPAVFKDPKADLYRASFITDDQLSVSKLSGGETLSPGATYKGRILEILINGQYARASVFDEALGFRDFWCHLFDDSAVQGSADASRILPQDAAGMLRRVSKPFSVIPSNGSKETGSLGASRRTIAKTRSTVRSASHGIAAEADAWAAVSGIAQAGYQFWKQFLVLRRGTTNGDSLGGSDDTEFLYVIRAVSWVESQHGTGGGMSAARDPMQCGNPGDPWWQQVSGQITSKDRFVCGPGASNYYPDQLPAAVVTDSNWNGNASVGRLRDPTLGHGTQDDDNNFNSTTSYWWGVPHLIWCINTKDGGRPTYQCGDVDRESLIHGAVQYNGGGDPDYEAKIRAAYALFTSSTSEAPRVAGTAAFVRNEEDGRVAEQIKAECALKFSTNSDDCNKFVKAVATVFFDPPLFSGPDMDADAIIKDINGGNGWTLLGKSSMRAIASAKSGQFVIAGMTASELGGSHGHLAIVIGDDGRPAGNVIVPICYAGSLNPAARVQRARISETFPAYAARTNAISYFCRAVQLLPESSPVSRLLDHLRAHEALV